MGIPSPPHVDHIKSRQTTPKAQTRAAKGSTQRQIPRPRNTPAGARPPGECTHTRSTTKKHHHHYQELRYKILTRWYKVPSLLQKMYPERTNKCWRCVESEGNMLHIFWSCKKIVDFWSKVRDTVRQLTEYDLGLDPGRYLLHLSDLPKCKYRNSLVVHLLNAAKACILAFWERKSPPPRSNYGFKK